VVAAAQGVAVRAAARSGSVRLSDCRRSSLFPAGDGGHVRGR